MTAAPLVVSSDVATALLRPLTDNEQTYIGDLCSQASAKLRTAMRTVDERIAKYQADADDPAGLDPDAVSAMLAGVVKRVIVNPNGTQNQSDTTGPFSRTWTFPTGGDLGAMVGQLVITPADLAQLAPVEAYAVPFTIRTRPKFGHCR